MALYPTVPVCIQLTDYELETPHLGVAPIYRTVVPPPPPYNPSLYPCLYEVEPPPHSLPQYVALVGIHPIHQFTNETSCKGSQDVLKESSTQQAEEKETKMITKEAILNKKEGKFGIRTAIINKNVFIYSVTKGSPAARAGVHVGDQLVKVNGTCLTGLTNDAVHDLIRRCPPCGIKFTFRSRKEYSIFKKLDSVKKTFGNL